MRSLVVALLVPLGCATGAAEPRPQPLPPTAGAVASQPARLSPLLAPEARPAPEQWKALGPEGLSLLRQVASDPAELPERRARAVSGMAFLDDAGSSAVLQSFATDSNALPAVRQSATLGLAVREGPHAVPMLAPLLGDGDVSVRLAAAQALGRAGGNDARTALQGRLDAETDPHVRDEIQKSLAKVTN
jgi:HEAT repeat protein